MFIQAIDCTQEIYAALKCWCNRIEVTPIPKVADYFEYSRRSVNWQGTSVSNKPCDVKPKQEKSLSCGADNPRASSYLI